MRRAPDRLFALVAATALLGWASPAEATVACDSSGKGLPTVLSGAIAGAAGIPAYLSKDSTLILGGGPSSFGDVESDGDDLAAFEFSGTAQGFWNRFGYRADFYSLEHDSGCSYSFLTSVSAAFSYIALQSGTSELRVSVGAGGSLPVGPALDVGVAGRFALGPHFGLETRLRYLPHLVASNQGGTHFGRGRLRFKWRPVPGIQPFAGVSGGYLPIDRQQTKGITSPAGLYFTGLIGFESNWSP